MNYVAILPTLITVEAAGAGIIYLIHGEWWKALYWTAAALLNLAVVMM